MQAWSCKSASLSGGKPAAAAPEPQACNTVSYCKGFHLAAKRAGMGWIERIDQEPPADLPKVSRMQAIPLHKGYR